MFYFAHHSVQHSAESNGLYFLLALSLAGIGLALVLKRSK